MKKLIIVLSIILGVGLTVAGGIFLGLAIKDHVFPPHYETVTHEYVVEDAFSSISFDTDVTDIELKASEDGQSKLVFNEREKYYHHYTVNEGTLSVTSVNEYQWYENMWGFNSRITATLYLPTGEYNALSIKTDTGDVNLDTFTFNNVSVEGHTGDVALNNLTVKENFVANMSTGDITLKNSAVTGSINIEVSTGKIALEHVTSASGNFKSSTGKVVLTDYITPGHLEVNTSTGDVNFSSSDADTINVTTSTGDVRGSIKSDHTFSVSTRTGDVSVPSTSGPACVISTSTGDVHITIG